MRNLNFLTNHLIAHRGIYNEHVKENTLIAFEKAIKHKMAIECDIQLTKDNRVVVFHDFTLKRIAGIKKSIKNLNYKELKKLAGYHIPTLEETLDLVNGRVTLLIELKTYNTKGALEEATTKLLDNYKGKFAIQSFSPKTIYWFKKNRPNYIRGQLITNNYDYNFIANIVYKHMLFNYITKPDFISYNVKGLPSRIIAKVRKKDIVIGWTVKSKEQLNEYKAYCDNFIVENVL